MGAGLELAMATDIRIAAESARLMAGYTRIGGSPDGGLTFTLPQAYEKAMRFSMRMTKRGMHRAVRRTDLEGQMRYELLNIGKCFSTEDAKEARQAFFEKRAPVFKGK